MNKIGLMTLDSHSYNYGGLLQEYALYRTLKNLGMNVEIIDFNLSTEIYTFSCKRNLLNLNLDKIEDKVRKKLNKKPKTDISEYVSLRHERFNCFRNNYLKLSRPYSAKTISEAVIMYDTFVCGSDQIWNPDFNVPEFFLNFVPDHQKKVIYGASLGQDKLSKRQLKVYKKLMSPLNYISVREDKAKELLQPISRTQIEVVLDPTLLMEPEQWVELVRIPQEINCEYIFCYFLDNNVKKQNAARRTAQELGLKIVTIPFLHDVYEESSVNFGDYRLSDIGPQEFLGLIRDARLVLTDSFHATVFSILLKKNFWTFGRNFGSYNMNSRIITLLSYFNLLDRYIEGKGVRCYESCNYKERYDVFEEKKINSLRFLKNTILPEVKRN